MQPDPELFQRIIGDRAVETPTEWKPIYWEWRRADLTGKNGLFVGDNINVNQSIGTRHFAKSRHGQAICQLFEMKRFFLFIGNLAECIEENVSTREKRRHAAGWFSRALAFRFLYYPWGKWGTTRSLYTCVHTTLIYTRSWGRVQKLQIKQNVRSYQYQGIQSFNHKIHIRNVRNSQICC